MDWLVVQSLADRECTEPTGMKLVTAAIYTNYKTSIVDDAGIEQIEGFIAGPKSGRLVLDFERV